MRNYLILTILAVLSPILGNSQSLTVWPGDASNNGLCNHVDLLYLGLNAGNTGPSRNTPSINWTPQQTQAWGQPSTVNLAHSDCNGDGTIDRVDALAIQGNFGLFTGGLLIQDSATIGGPASPVLLIDIVPDTFLVQGQAVLSANLSIGSSQNPLDSLYGIAFTMNYDPGIVDNISINLDGGWINNDSNAVIISRIDSTLGTIMIGITRMDHSNRSGYGTIGSISIVMDDNIRVAGNWNLIFETSFIAAYSSSGTPILIQPSNDTLTVITSKSPSGSISLQYGPNPADENFRIHCDNHKLDMIRIYDTQGNLVYLKTENILEYNTISTLQLPSGCYFLEVHAENEILREKLIVHHY